MPDDPVVVRPGEHGVRGQLHSVVRDDHAWLAAAFDQRRQLARHAPPEIEVSGIAARHSRVTSSTMFRMRNRRPQASWSWTKSRDQRRWRPPRRRLAPAFPLRAAATAACAPSGPLRGRAVDALIPDGSPSCAANEQSPIAEALPFVGEIAQMRPKFCVRRSA